MVTLVYAGADHLLLTEICVTPSNVEFIEIYNPTSVTVSLENVYITDLYGDISCVEDFYPQLPVGPVTHTANNFCCMFPAGTSIAAGEVIVIALNGNSFFNHFGFAADYDIRGLGGGAIPMKTPANGYTGPSAGLTDAYEVVVLYYYSEDFNGDICYDIDYALWGDAVDKRVDKTGITINQSMYLDDTAFGSQNPIAVTGHSNGYSFQRVDMNEGNETSSGGNGYTGHDETSENLSVTWLTAITSPGNVFTTLERETWGSIKATF